MKTDNKQQTAGSSPDTCSLSVGDSLAFRCGYGRGNWQIETIQRFTPSGRIICGRFTLNPDLTVRGRGSFRGPYRGEPVTEEIKQEVERTRNLAAVKHCDWDRQPSEVISRIAAILGENSEPQTPSN